jgi:hypothetical protein
MAPIARKTGTRADVEDDMCRELDSPSSPLYILPLSCSNGRLSSTSADGLEDLGSPPVRISRRLRSSQGHSLVQGFCLLSVGINHHGSEYTPAQLPAVKATNFRAAPLLCDEGGTNGHSFLHLSDR